MSLGVYRKLHLGKEQICFAESLRNFDLENDEYKKMEELSSGVENRTIHTTSSAAFTLGSSHGTMSRAKNMSSSLKG